MLWYFITAQTCISVESLSVPLLCYCCCYWMLELHELKAAKKISTSCKFCKFFRFLRSLQNADYAIPSAVHLLYLFCCKLQFLYSYLLRGGFQKKTRQIFHFLWISVFPPPPLSTSAGVNNIHTKEFFYPHLLTPPPLALIHFYRY